MAYNMPGRRVDGMNVIEVYEATTAAIDAARKGEGPQFLEMQNLSLRRPQHW